MLYYLGNNQIRNCLASLESLETELISAISTFYLHPESKEMRENVKLLTGQWQLEVNKLHDAINLIIDSGAYCQVFYDDIYSMHIKDTSIQNFHAIIIIFR